MKKTLLLFSVLITSFTSFAQVGIGTNSPDASSALDIASTTSGILIPRMTMAERDAISPPIATGLLIYQTDNTPGFYYYNGSTWTTFGGVDNDWTISGNDIFNANTGNVGIGTANPGSKFHISGTTVPGVPGGTITHIDEDFEGYTVTQNHVSDPDCTNTDGWGVLTSGTSIYPCAGCVDSRAEIDSDIIGCDQDATMIMNFGQATATTSVDISFDYRYEDYSASATDMLRIYLYDNDGAAQVGPDLVSTMTDTDTNYSGTVTVVAGTNYSLRFEYFGSFAFGATIDNVLVTETITPVPGTYMFRLEDGQQQAGYVLTSDGNGNATWQAAGSTGTDDQMLSIAGNMLTIEDGNTVTLPTGSSNTYENGLTLSGGTVRLGGDLTQTTFINLLGNDLDFESSGGRFIIEDDDGQFLMEADPGEEFVGFGEAGSIPDSDNGQNFDDTFGTTFTRKFMLGYHNGATGGSGFQMGSIEYAVDGTDELFFELSALSPLNDGIVDLGVAPFSGVLRAWDDVNAYNYVVVSDGRLKEDIKTIDYGLKDLMKLNPVSYKWKRDYVGKTRIPEDLKVTKLGFVAQELLEVIPEVVKTHDWKVRDEESREYEYLHVDRYGVMYSDLVPVTIKAIQEQQAIIDRQEEKIAQLEEKLEALSTVVENALSKN